MGLKSIEILHLENVFQNNWNICMGLNARLGPSTERLGLPRTTVAGQVQSNWQMYWRLNVARDLLAVDMTKLQKEDPSLNNFIVFFKEQLQEVVRTKGTCPYNLFMTIKIWRRKWRCSVAPNESLHSLLKCLHNRSKNISQALLNARLHMKSFLGKHEQFNGVGFSGNASQVKLLASIGKSLLDTCEIAGYGLAMLILDYEHLSLKHLINSGSPLIPPGQIILGSEYCDDIISECSWCGVGAMIPVSRNARQFRALLK